MTAFPCEAHLCHRFTFRFTEPLWTVTCLRSTSLEHLGSSAATGAFIFSISIHKSGNLDCGKLLMGNKWWAHTFNVALKVLDISRLVCEITLFWEVFVDLTWKAWFAKPKPSCLQTTMASIVPQLSLHTVPHTRELFLCVSTSTRPS